MPIFLNLWMVQGLAGKKHWAGKMAECIRTVIS